jgi:DNA-binding FadR family transcriptional regulator
MPRQAAPVHPAHSTPGKLVKALGRSVPLAAPALASAPGRAQRRDTLRRQLLDLIQLQGEGGRLPPERELSERLGVARETLRRGLDQLQAEGLLQRRQGAGTFVAGAPLSLIHI